MSFSTASDTSATCIDDGVPFSDIGSTQLFSLIVAVIAAIAMVSGALFSNTTLVTVSAALSFILSFSTASLDASTALRAQSVHSLAADSTAFIDSTEVWVFASKSDMAATFDILTGVVAEASLATSLTTSSAAFTTESTPLSADFNAATAAASVIASFPIALARASAACSSILIFCTASFAATFTASIEAAESFPVDVLIASSTFLTESITSLALACNDSTAFASAVAVLATSSAIFSAAFMSPTTSSAAFSNEATTFGSAAISFTAASATTSTDLTDLISSSEDFSNCTSSTESADAASTTRSATDSAAFILFLTLSDAFCRSAIAVSSLSMPNFETTFSITLSAFFIDSATSSDTAFKSATALASEAALVAAASAIASTALIF